MRLDLAPGLVVVTLSERNLLGGPPLSWTLEVGVAAD